MTNGFFCRFAFCTAEGGKTAAITPVSSSLLQRKDRWRPVKFTCPLDSLVFDLTPNVLGPAEGFSQAGYLIHSAIGFDPERHLTWKVRLSHLIFTLLIFLDATSHERILRWSTAERPR